MPPSRRTWASLTHQLTSLAAPMLLLLSLAAVACAGQRVSPTLTPFAPQAAPTPPSLAAYVEQAHLQQVRRLEFLDPRTKEQRVVDDPALIRQVLALLLSPGQAVDPTLRGPQKSFLLLMVVPVNSVDHVVSADYSPDTSILAVSNVATGAWPVSLQGRYPVPSTFGQALFEILGLRLPRDGGGFAIYLPGQNLSPAEVSKADLRTLRLADEPVLASGDIVFYASDTHEIRLTPAAAERLARLKVPGGGPGIPFVVCVGREPIYSGAFWSLTSSLSFEGVAIEVFPRATRDAIRIQLCYPESSEMFEGQDLRSDPRILRALEQAGKLK